MGAIASQITSLTMAYSTDYPDADQRKHQSSTSLAFVWGIHRGAVNSPPKWPVTRKMYPFDDVIMNFVCITVSILAWTHAGLHHLCLYIAYQELADETKDEKSNGEEIYGIFVSHNWFMKDIPVPESEQGPDTLTTFCLKFKFDVILVLLVIRILTITSLPILPMAWHMWCRTKFCSDQFVWVEIKAKRNCHWILNCDGKSLMKWAQCTKDLFVQFDKFN